MEVVRRGDKAEGEPVSTHTEEGARELRKAGESFVQQLKRPFLREAARAWKGERGGTWLERPGRVLPAMGMAAGMSARDAPRWKRGKTDAMLAASGEEGRGWFMSRAAADRAAREDVREGMQADGRGRWAIESIEDMRRARGKKGDAIEVQVKWRGRDRTTGEPFGLEWIAQRLLTADLRKEARKWWDARKAEERRVEEQDAKRRCVRRSPRLDGGGSGTGKDA
mmetsp:Transcript_34416/g.90560  ORF Transcript_34416/g.90560 Transcript_34416/m.90560 type:complete len:224 (-) Transcript_34416:108-779(-)